MPLIGEYAEVSRRLIRQAAEELERGDLIQASEKAWGAAAQAVKAIAEQREWAHSSHFLLFQAVSNLVNETGQPEIRRLFGVANSLHTNFYEHWMDPDSVEGSIADVRMLVDMLEGVP